jgi:hypothetical protein
MILKSVSEAETPNWLQSETALHFILEKTHSFFLLKYTKSPMATERPSKRSRKDIHKLSPTNIFAAHLLPNQQVDIDFNFKIGLQKFFEKNPSDFLEGTVLLLDPHLGQQRIECQTKYTGDL